MPALNPIIHATPNNQVSTMAAYPDPSYPVPRQQAILQARGANPLFRDPSQLDPSRYNALLAGNAPTPVRPYPGTAPAPPQSGQPGGIGSMGVSNGGAAEYGPDQQTAAGGVMDPAAPADFRQESAWRDFFNSKGAQQPGTPPRTPPVVAGQRLGSSFVGPYRPRVNA